jgi:hypothetical protein
MPLWGLEASRAHNLYYRHRFDRNCFNGSAPELVETRILGGFLKNDKFGLGDGHALGLEQ